jgi:hypothetical protein
MRSTAIIDFAGQRRACTITGRDAHSLVVEPPPPVATHARVTILAASAPGRVHQLIARVVWRTNDAMGLVLLPAQSFSTTFAA